MSQTKVVFTRRKQSKYKNVKTVIDGITFDSKKEAQYYWELKILQRAGDIRDLELQPVFTVTINDITICKYKADFAYTLTKTGERIIVDVKGVRTPVYRIKKKAVEAQFSVKITEI